MALFMTLAGYVFTLPLNKGSTASLIALIVASSCFVTTYWLARKGRTHLASIANCMFGMIAIFGVSALLSDVLSTSNLYYLVAVCIYASTFLSLRQAVWIVVAYSILLLLLGPTVTRQSLEDILGGPFTFNILSAGFVFLFVYYWRLRESRKRDALALSEARYRAVSEHVSDYMFFARFNSEAGRTIIWDTADQFEALTGYTTTELGEDTFMLVIHPDDRPPVFAGRARIRAGEATCDEVRMIRKDGSMRWLRIERLPVHEAEDTQPAGYYGIIVDITEERNSRQVQDELALRRAQFSTIDTFVKAISHDFRNRLSSIETTRYLISRQVSPESLERIKPRLDQISTHIDDMMMQLTNLTLINALNNPYLNSLNVNELCRTVYDKFVHQARTKSLQMRLELADAQPMLTADAEQLERALTHLLRNALTHTSTGGVTLRTTVEGECAIIEVEDTGYGIASKNLPLIFEPFYRGDDARTVTHAGVGLGLTLVRLIVEAHQGTIDVSSALGQGTTFRISLPMRDTLVA